MGIKGLFPFISDCQQKTKISKFRSQTVGVDAFCWIHRGTYSCAQDIVMGIPTTKFVSFVMKRVTLLLNHGITPILVFDGKALPEKEGTNDERRARRREAKEEALKLVKSGKKSQAFEFFQKAVDVTPEMVCQVIEACKSIGVSCLISPFESDAQLSYLYRAGIITLAISEDSDLLVYGCRKVFYKMDADGNGVFVNMDCIGKVKSLKNQVNNPDFFRHLCILSGCDYLKNIFGIGINTACSYLLQYNCPYEAIKALRLQKGANIVYEGFEDEFRKANDIFLNQTVFDPIKRRLATVSGRSIECSEEEIQQARQLSLGNINPKTMKPLASHSLDDFKLLKQIYNPESFEEALCFKVEKPSLMEMEKENVSLKSNIKEEINEKLSQSDGLMITISQEERMSLYKNYEMDDHDEFTSFSMKTHAKNLDTESSQTSRYFTRKRTSDLAKLESDSKQDILNTSTSSPLSEFSGYSKRKKSITKKEIKTEDVEISSVNDDSCRNFKKFEYSVAS